MTMPIAILCGGKGTRLGDLTWVCPKSLVQVADRPFIYWQLELLKESGFEEVVLCTGHLAYMIYDAVGDGRSFGLKVHYSYDGPVPLGTAGAIRRALPILGEEFCTLYGDSYLDLDYQGILQYWDLVCPTALMTKYEGVDYGFGVFKREALLMTSGRELKGVYAELHASGNLRVHDTGVPFCEIGSREGLAETEAYIVKTRLQGTVPGNTLPAADGI